MQIQRPTLIATLLALLVGAVTLTGPGVEAAAAGARKAKASQGAKGRWGTVSIAARKKAAAKRHQRRHSKRRHKSAAAPASGTAVGSAPSPGQSSPQGGDAGGQSGKAGGGQNGSTPMNQNGSTPKQPTKPSTPPPSSNPPSTPPTPQEPAPQDPAPQPTTPPPSSSGGSAADILFQANSLRDFWLRQSAPGAVTEVPDPAGSGQTVFRFTVSDNDVYPITPTENPRAELLSPSTIKDGDELWWSTKFLLPADFPASVPGWVNLAQVFGKPWTGSPPIHLEVNGSYLQMTRNQTYGYDVPWRMPLVRGAWIHVMVHMRFARDGFVELWVNGQQVTFFNSGGYNPKKVAPTQRLAMQTMDSSNDVGTNSVYLQHYRKRGMFPTLTTYAGPLKIGRTQASVAG